MVLKDVVGVVEEGLGVPFCVCGVLCVLVTFYIDCVLYGFLFVFSMG